MKVPIEAKFYSNWLRDNPHFDSSVDAILPCSITGVSHLDDSGPWLNFELMKGQAQPAKPLKAFKPNKFKDIIKIIWAIGQHYIKYGKTNKD